MSDLNSRSNEYKIFKKDMDDKRKKAYSLLDNSEIYKDYINWVKKPSRRAYSYHLAEFIIFKDFINLDDYIQDISKLKHQDRENYFSTLKKDLKNYIVYLEENRKPETFSPKTINVSLSAFQDLLSYNEIDLPSILYKKLRKRNGQSPVTYSKTPSKDELRLIFSNCDLELISFALIQLSSGSRSGEIRNLILDEIEWNYDFPRFRVLYENSKTNKPIRKRMSTEAKEYTLKYINQRRDKILKTRIKRNTKNHNINDKLLFPISTSTLNDKWANALKKSGLYELDPKTNKPTMGLHSLRRYFNDNFSEYKRSWARFFMGKSDEYDTFSDKKLDRHFKLGCQHLYVFDTPIDSNPVIIDLQKQNVEQHKMIENLQSTSNLYKDILEKQDDKINQLNNLVERLVYDNINPFSGPELSKQSELIEEKIEKKAIKEHNDDVVKHYKEKVEQGEKIKLVNMDGLLFIADKTDKYDRLRDLIKKYDNPVDEKQREKYKEETKDFMKFLDDSIVSFSIEESELISKFKKFYNLPSEQTHIRNKELREISKKQK